MVLPFFGGGIEVIWFYVRQNVFGNRLPNYSVVDETALHRGGQPSTTGVHELAQQGIKTIINLRLGNFSKKVIEEYSQHRLRIVHLPFSPHEPQDQIMIDFFKCLAEPKVPSCVCPLFSWGRSYRGCMRYLSHCCARVG